MSFQVWDGTRCPHTLLKVIVEPNITEGPSSFSAERENLIANVLVYDNHVEFARQLKVRAHWQNPNHEQDSAPHNTWRLKFSTSWSLEQRNDGFLHRRSVNSEPSGFIHELLEPVINNWAINPNGALRSCGGAFCSFVLLFLELGTVWLLLF